jgi:hypothetical protein
MKSVKSLAEDASSPSGKEKLCLTDESSEFTKRNNPMAGAGVIFFVDVLSSQRDTRAFHLSTKERPRDEYIYQHK